MKNEDSEVCSTKLTVRHGAGFVSPAFHLSEVLSKGLLKKKALYE